MKRKIVTFSAIVIALCILCIVKAPYWLWSIGGFEDERFFIFAIFALLSGVLYFSIGCCFLYGNVFTQSSSAIPPMLAAKFIDHYKKVEIKLKSSIKETTFCFVILFVTFGGLSLYLVGKFDEYVAYGDCLFTKYPPGGKVSSLYTKDGRTIVDNKHYYLDFTKHEDCMLSDSDIGIDEPYYNDKSCVIECPGGPYFCYIKKVKIDQKSKGESYEYNKYDNRVYYQYEDYRIDYLIAIYNSAGSYIDDYEDDFRFEYFPNKKKIDGKEYSYWLYGDDIEREYEFAEKLGKMVAEYLTDYISEMNKEKQTPEYEREVTPQPAPQSAPQPTPQPKPSPVPVQVFKKCWSCLVGGQCGQCYGSGSIYYPYPTGEQRCPVCGGTGRCNICAGRGGEYIVEYH